MIDMISSNAVHKPWPSMYSPTLIWLWHYFWKIDQSTLVWNSTSPCTSISLVLFVASPECNSSYLSLRVILFFCYREAKGDFFFSTGWPFNQRNCFKMMSFIKPTNLIALKVHHPLCLHINSPLKSTRAASTIYQL